MKSLAVLLVAGAPAFAVAAPLAPAPAQSAVGSIGAACGVAANTSDETLRALPQPERDRLVACLMGESARVLRKRLPIAVNEMTTLRSVRADGNTMRYTYGIALNDSEMSPAQKDRLEQETRAQVCRGEDARAMMALGGRYAYRLQDVNGLVIRQFTVTAC